MGTEQISGIFEVNSVEYVTTQHRGDNGVMGPGYSSWLTGTSTEINLSMTPKDNKKAMKASFLGYAPVEVGDTIKVYFKRDAEEGIKISKIEKLTKENKILFTATTD